MYTTIMCLHNVMLRSNKRLIVFYKILMDCFVTCYRHTDEMISKLESAGLGFYVKATETQQKLGKMEICM